MNKTDQEFTGKTVTEAKTYLKNNWTTGVACPCCNQLVRLYKRKLNSGMARTLILIYKENRKNPGWIYVKEFLRVNAYHNNHDWTLLSHWGLLEEKMVQPGEPNSGLWRITAAGVAFVEMRLLVPKYKGFYNSRSWNGSDEKIDIKQALKNRFDYKELMQINE